MPFRKLPLAALAMAVVAGSFASATAQICPPREGVELPRAYLDRIAEDPTAFRTDRALKTVAERASKVREQMAMEGPLPRSSMATAAVSGNYQIPVLMGKFANTGADPFPVIDLEQELFGGGVWTNTLTAHYTEMSNGLLNVSGTVYPWHTLNQNDNYYEGNAGDNGLAQTSKTGEFLQENLDARDGSVDFGQYDNDGPDGVPNSGDDDGYVDFVAFVHAEAGGECGNNNLWSHRWVYRGWNGSPYVTNDAAANGGFILVDDYVIQPAISCGGGMIEIGVFSHEFGHAFGLPDLYDTNGGSAGVGYWDLMGSGNWNDPDLPAHMGAWTKDQLGWVNVVEVDWQGTPLVVPPVVDAPTVYSMGWSEDRWRRRTDCVISGSGSLAVGFTAAEGNYRKFPGSAGYGNFWFETVARDFHYNGSGTVTLSYDYDIDTEFAYDFAFLVVEVGGVSTTLQVYDGNTSGTEVQGLNPVLGAGAKDYKVKFVFTSDAAYSDEDGNFNTACSPFVVDNISLVGGGENYSADFEAHRGGWYESYNDADNPRNERFLVENRQQQGFDGNLFAEGLLIWHIDDMVMGSLGNSGGGSNIAVRGVVVEEPDNNNSLTTSGTRAQVGDIWSGALNNTFDSASTPSSRSNTALSTQVSVANITPVGNDMSATFTAGDPAPVMLSVNPAAAADTDGVVVVELQGEANVRHGATLRLVRSGAPDILPVDVEWVDYDNFSASFDFTGGSGGDYDVVLENPDGQTVVLSQGFQLSGTQTGTGDTPGVPNAVALGQNYPNPFNPSTTIRFDLPVAGPARLDIVDARGRQVRSLVSGDMPAGFHSIRWDGNDGAGRPAASGLYFYRLEAGEQLQQRKMLLLK